MALVLEDGTNVDGSNTYITLASAGTYMENRTDANWTSASTTEKEHALIQAGMYLNTLNWKGQKISRDQSMQFPRQNLYDEDGYLYATNAIPSKVAEAQVEAALAHLGSYDLMPTVQPGDKIKRKKIDVIEKEFFGGASSQKTDFTKVEGLLRGLISSGVVIARA
ncbi:MAG: DnaT-like ssDNA-binding protein [Planctomycetota bacterium]|jgi:hypothetical protein